MRLRERIPVYQIPVFILILVLIISCYPERKLAREYIDSKPEISIMILPTNYVFKKNLKIGDLENAEGLSEWELDSTLFANSLFLKDLSDSIFLETFINSLIIEFEELGFKVYTENMLDSFLFLETPAYIFNIAQIELEEHYNIHEDKEEFGDYVYYKKVDLNAITYNFWFELSELNDEEESRKLFFVSETINDLIYGFFTENVFSGGIKYRYSKNEINLDVVYRYCSIYGQRYAGYTFDYLMNKYLDENWPADKKRRYYMQYKRYNNTLDPTWEERFFLMEE